MLQQPTWHGLDSFVGSCVRPEHIAHVPPSCGPLDGVGRGEGAVDPATKTHHTWFIESGPQLHFGPEMPAHNLTILNEHACPWLASEETKVK